MFLSLGAVTNNVYAETNEPSLSEQQIQFEAEQIEKQLNQEMQELFKIYSEG
ncbi:hypothetical protein [Bacillus sp. S10(2024)]|uniref:hypothetical protein n=1 Tax=Bacillus sp. S10(2024) TaxID=3162886 RepID=UPI003D25BD7E